ncbi:hypothetical protein L4D15_16165 [Enterovibrio norvegicus]|uniref:alpha-amylase family glycosyl hydrolase n=1 Tax=Enterovibrio norvegicus TaxID=188144 RepID=UPI003D126A98
MKLSASPIFESPLSDFGYDITNLSAINPEYGDMSTFTALVEEAKACGFSGFRGESHVE